MGMFLVGQGTERSRICAEQISAVKNFDVWREVARKFGSRSWSGCLREIQHLVIINIEKKRSDEV